MTILQRAARDIGVVGSSYLFMWVVTILFTVAQARYLGPARFGELSLALAYAAFLTFFIDFGLSAQLSRTVAQRVGRYEDALGATMVVRAGLWLAATPCVWVITVLLGYPPELQQTTLILAVSVLLIGVINTIGAYLQGQQEFMLQSVAGVTQRLVATGVGVLMLMLGADLTAIAAAFVIGAMVNLAVLFVRLRGRPWVHPRIDPASALGILRGAIPLGAWFIAAAFYGNFGLLALERLAPAENVGWYAAAFRLFGVAAMVPAIVAGMVLYPVLSRLSLGSRHELRAVIEKTLTFLTLSGVAVALVFALCADQIVALLYRAEAYAEAASALRILALGLPFLYVNAVFIFSLFGLHQERRLLVVACVAAIVNPFANLIAITLFEQDGAAAIMSLTELALLVWLIRAMPADLLSRESVRVAGKAGAAAIATALVVGLVRDQGLVALAALTLAVYGVVLLLLRTVAAHDLSALRGLIGAPAAAAAPHLERPSIHEEVA
jgi:O-antigen/teichoic acid export membrane protein